MWRRKGVVALMLLMPMLMIAQSNPCTKFGDFKVEQAEKAMVINGEPVETYVIHYDDLDEPIFVGVFCEDSCRNFIVRASNFEVQYICNKNGLGVCYPEVRFATMDRDELYKRIDRLEYLRQRLITCTGEKKPTRFQVKMIASFVPALMKAG